VELGNNGGVDEDRDITMVRTVGEFFINRGFRYVGDEDGIQIYEDSFRVFVIELKVEEAWSGGILKAVLKAISLSGSGEIVYIALPRSVARHVDGKLLWDRGIGLLVLGEEVIEAVKPRGKIEEIREELMGTVIQLERERSEGRLLEAIKKLEEKIDTLETTLRQIERGRPIQPTRTRREEGVEKEAVKHEVKPTIKPTTKIIETADFMKDNPWIEILSKRGKEKVKYT